jgi:hypothetical protein
MRVSSCLPTSVASIAASIRWEGSDFPAGRGYSLKLRDTRVLDRRRRVVDAVDGGAAGCSALCRRLSI